MSRRKRSRFESPFLLALCVFIVLVFTGFFAMLSGQENIQWSSGTMLTGAAVGLGAKEGGVIIFDEATSTSCGSVSTNITLTADIISNGTCMNITADSVVVDCAGYTITYAAYENSKRYGINNTGYNNVTIKNCRIIEGNTSATYGYGIYFKNAQGGLLLNNTVVTVGTDSYGIYFVNGDYNNITRNRINTSGLRGDGFNLLSGASDNSIMYNNITTTGSAASGSYVYSSNSRNEFRNNIFITTGGGHGVWVRTSSNNLFSSNTINVTGADSGDYGMELQGGSGNIIFGNNINVSGSNGVGIHLYQSTASNILSNNNISAHQFYEIWDETTSSQVNYFIYNNSYGEIRWIDHGASGFLQNLTLNVTDENGFWLGNKIFIENNTVALDVSAFSTGGSLMNQSANITLRGLTYGIINETRTVSNYTLVSNDIITWGDNCNGTSCLILSYSGRALIFNVTHFSSFAANGYDDITAPLISANAALNDTDLVMAVDHAKLNITVTDDAAVDTVFFTITPFGNITATKNENEYYVVCSPGNTCNTSATGSFNWTSVWVNDSTGNINSSSQSLQFNVTVGCASTLIISETLTQNVSSCSNNGVVIEGDNVVLDCGGHTISHQGYSPSGNNGVVTNYTRNVTIKNCVIEYFAEGINLSSKSNTTLILNNTIRYSMLAGIYLPGDSLNTSVINNTITYTNGTVDLVSSSFTKEGSLAGIMMFSGGSKGTSTFTTIKGNTISHNVVSGINFQSSWDAIEDNTFYNNTNGIDFSSESAASWQKLVGNRFEGNIKGVLLNGTSIAIIGGAGGFPYIQDSPFINNSYDVYTATGSSAEITFINSSVNRSKMVASLGTTVRVKRYVDINLKDSSGDALDGIGILAYNVLDEVDDSGNTLSTGVARLNLTEYYFENNIAYITTPTTIYTSTPTLNYTKNITVVDLRTLTNNQINFTITTLSCGSTISSDAFLGGNFTCSGTAFTIANDNVEIFGNGNFIRGTGTGQGFNITGRKNVYIDNLYVTNFSTGLYLQDTINSSFINLIVFNNTVGIILNESGNNSFYELSLWNSTEVNIIGTSTNRAYTYLINSSTDIQNVSLLGLSSLFRKWYTTVNVTLKDDGTALSGVLVNATFQDSGVVDKINYTDSAGLTILELSEMEVNRTGITYLGSYVLNVSKSFAGSLYKNSTVLNLTITNNSYVNLSIDLPCITPKQFMYLTNVTSNFCPGTFTADNITIASNNTVLTCPEDTTIVAATNQNYIISIESKRNVTIQGCIWSGRYVPAIYISEGSTNVTIFDNNFTTRSFYTLSGTSVSCASSNGLNVTQNTFYDTAVHLGSGCDDARIVNNTFVTTGGLISAVAIQNSKAYHNDFQGASIHYVEDGGYTSTPLLSLNTTINISGSVRTQGNKYADYCGKGSDTDGDGYADASSSDSVDWPYNATTSSYITEHYSTRKLTDYAPLVFDCVTTIQLGTGGGGGSSASAASAASAAAPAPAAPSAPSQGKTQSNGKGYMSAEEVLKNMKIDSGPSLDKAEDQKITLSLTNTGDKTAYFESEVKAEKEESFTVYQSKSLEHTAQSLGTGWLPTGNLGKERLTTISIPTDLESFSVSPGETKNIELDIGALSATKRTISFVLKEANSQQDVLEKEAVLEPVWGNAVDHISEENLVDIYIVKPEEDAAAPSRTYTFEISVIQQGQAEPPLAGMKSLLARFLTNPPWERRVLYSETYGPRIIGREGFIFTQQYKYDCRLYNGKLIISVKTVDEKGSTIVDNEFPLEMGCNQNI